VLQIIAVVKYQVPVGLSAGGKKYPSHTRLDSGRVRVPPAGKKSSPYPYPSGRVPDGYRVLVPELPSLGIVDFRKVRAQNAAASSLSTGGSSFIPHRSEERQEIEMLKKILRQRDEEMWRRDGEQRQQYDAMRPRDDFYAQAFARKQIILQVS
jgi:hypothetical protein